MPPYDHVCATPSQTLPQRQRCFNHRFGSKRPSKFLWEGPASNYSEGPQVPFIHHFSRMTQLEHVYLYLSTGDYPPDASLSMKRGIRQYSKNFSISDDGKDYSIEFICIEEMM